MSNDSKNSQWESLCREQDLVAEAGVAVWSPAGAIALFWLPDTRQQLFAIGHFDPMSEANVLARGIVGDIQGEPVVASPIYKHHYSLESGQCLEEEDVRVPVFPARLHQGEVQIIVGEARRHVA